MRKKLLGILSIDECIIMANMPNKCVYVHEYLCTNIFYKQAILGWRQSFSRDLWRKDKARMKKFYLDI